jgi:predicted naringenin-chalcone synthase
MADAFLVDFRAMRPRHSADHAEGVKWLAQAHAKAESLLKPDPDFDRDAFARMMERHILRFGCGPESLARRGHGLEDFLHLDWDRMRVFNLDRHPAGAGMGARMEVFSEIADAAAEGFFQEGSEPPDDIIHVTCTGYVAPSAVQKLVARRGWHARTGVTHAYHMGCYAAMPAVRMAAGFLASADGGSRGAGLPAGPPGTRRVEIVHNEACTLHLDPTRHHPEQLVVQSLFADGHIRYGVTASPPKAQALRFLGSREEIVPGSLEAMGWNLDDRGMRMILSREVPDLIGGSVKDFLRRLFSACGVDAAEALASGVFAVHPGGPRIIDKVAALLELAPGQVEASRAVLRDCGNMSSATIPHVWAHILADDKVKSGAVVTSLAFGPGLTIYGALLRKT